LLSNFLLHGQKKGKGALPPPPLPCRHCAAKIKIFFSRVGSEARFLPGVYYEKRWEQDINDFRREMNIEEPPII
jgi:hypothetical protein